MADNDVTGVVPEIFDESLIMLRRARARRINVLLAAERRPDFLMRIATEDILDRLRLIRREFADVLVLGSDSPMLVTGIGALYPAARVAVADVIEGGGCHPNLSHALRSLESLELDAHSFDLIVSPLMLQWVNDLPGVLAQLQRALKPDGLLIANLMGGRSLSELREAFLVGDAETTGGASPRVHPMIDVREMGGLLQRAKFALPVADADVVTVTYAGLLSLLNDLRALGATNVLADQKRGGMRRDTLMATAAAYARASPQANGRISTTFEIVTVTGWAPHESQQKPLKPGSAQQRLADALKDSSSR